GIEMRLENNLKRKVEMKWGIQNGNKSQCGSCGRLAGRAGSETREDHGGGQAQRSPQRGGWPHNGRDGSRNPRTREGASSSPQDLPVVWEGCVPDKGGCLLGSPSEVQRSPAAHLPLPGHGDLASDV